MALVPRIPHRMKQSLLLAGVLLTAALVTQCKMVTDSVVRPQVSATKAGNCISECNKVANEAMRKESDLHTSNVKACQTPECKEAETIRHEAAVAAIQQQRLACHGACHHQGGGSGGR